MPVDLHIHTSFSDSTLTPREVVSYAHQMGLSAIGITDHDTVDGIEPTMEIAKEYDLEIIPAIELSASLNQRNEVHILGYYINWRDQRLKDLLQDFCEKRESRAYQMVRRLARGGIEIGYERVLEVAGKGSIGRLHIAQVLCEKGWANSIDEAFTNYLKKNSPYYVEKLRLSPDKAVRIILEAGGVPVIGHPWYFDCHRIIKRLLPHGLRGIEVYHSEHSTKHISLFQDLAEKYGLLITGGSDCHGLNKGAILIGKVTVDDDILDRLKKIRDEIKGRGLGG